jgi:nucleotide-binding universal stress UspA family protein
MTTHLRSILSPVDFSEPSRQALRWAGALALRFQSQLTVINVVDPLLAEAARIQLNQDLAKAQTEPALRDFVATTWPDPPDQRHPAVEPAFRTPTGDPATEILHTAIADGADLIVVGTQGLGGWRKWLLGSTTERLLRRTQVPVLAVPRANEAHVAVSAIGMVSQILAATDFSESSVAAAKVAVDLAHEFSATLTLLHIIHRLAVPPHLQDIVETSDAERAATARAKLKALAEQICGAYPCEEVVVLGHPAELIGSIADDRRAQMIVMGLASDQGPLSPRPGSIAYRVLCSTATPVLVVPSAHA